MFRAEDGWGTWIGVEGRRVWAKHDQIAGLFITGSPYEAPYIVHENSRQVGAYETALGAQVHYMLIAATY